MHGDASWKKLFVCPFKKGHEIAVLWHSTDGLHQEFFSESHLKKATALLGSTPDTCVLWHGLKQEGYHGEKPFEEWAEELACPYGIPPHPSEKKEEKEKEHHHEDTKEKHDEKVSETHDEKPAEQEWEIESKHEEKPDETPETPVDPKHEEEHEKHEEKEEQEQDQKKDEPTEVEDPPKEDDAPHDN